MAKKLSTLASNVHWFHEDILSPASAHTIAHDGEVRDVGSRFGKIETTKDEILEDGSLPAGAEPVCPGQPRLHRGHRLKGKRTRT